MFISDGACSPTIVGTYNTTFRYILLSSCLVRAVVLAKYTDNLLMPNAPGEIPFVIELGPISKFLVR
jgi:hypothetical protein